MSKKTIVTEFKLTIPTWRSVEAEEMPMFNENRNHQGTTGNPYPCRIVNDVDRVHREDKEYVCISLENEYLRLEILPELGGRVYSALDKRTGYDFLYKQHVIKPALIGYMGEWISGGLEFNWPCHHRPSTFMPTDYTIEEEEDGTVTVWLGENDPLYRTRGMVGISLAPDAAVFDTKMRLYNRTAVRRPFMWWENAAVPVNEQYRLFFPPDVHYVQNHYRRHNTNFPIAQSEDYAGIRMRDPRDISYHKNSRAATSYFAAASHYDFFGGYDEGKNCGVVHVSDSRISQGKKMFTWGYGTMENAWEKALTDEDGMYAELMAGSYTTDQPDFTWIQPYETKEFIQSWYPIGDMGIPTMASYHAAVNVDGCELSLQSTRKFSGVILKINGQDAAALDLNPGDIWPLTWKEEIITVELIEDGLSILSYEKKEEGETELPPILPGMPPIEELETADDFYLTGVHADQYRDPLILPETYFEAGVRRFPNDYRLLHALARARFMKGYYEEAYDLGMRAWKAVTRWNFRPESGDIPYTLGLICETLDKDSEAMDWYARACWQGDCAQRAFTRMAMLSLRMNDPVKAASYAKKAGDENLMALAAGAVAFSRLQRTQEAENCLARMKALDPLFVTGRCLMGCDEGAVWLTDPAQTALDLANDLCELDQTKTACDILAKLENPTRMTAIVCEYLGGPTAQIKDLPVGIAYPLRELERRALHAHLEKMPEDAAAAGLLGCWYYGHTHYEKADMLWCQAIKNDPNDWISCRNHAAALYTHLGRRQEALDWMKKAIAIKKDNEKLLWETVYVMTRLHCTPKERIAMVEEHMDVCTNDVWLEYVEAFNQAGEYEKALEKLLSREFVPREGAEGYVTAQYLFSNCALGNQALAAGRYEQALDWFNKGMELPASLGAGLWQKVALVPFEYGKAICLEQLGEQKMADELFDDILSRVRPDASLPALDVYQAKILMHRGMRKEAEKILCEFMDRAEKAAKVTDPGWYAITAFYQSFIEPAKQEREAASLWLKALANEALGNKQEALWQLEHCMEKNPQNLDAYALYALLKAE